MAGIFPEGGTAASNTLGGQGGPVMAALCNALYYRSNCNPRFDPIATNSLISEVVNAVNVDGRAYNCGSLTNLRDSMLSLVNTLRLPALSVDIDDRIRGSFNNVEGHASVYDLMRLSPGWLPGSGLDDSHRIPVAFSGNLATSVSFYDMKAAILAAVPDPPTPETPVPPPFTGSYTYKDVIGQRTPGIAYRNDYSLAIQVSIQLTGDGEGIYVSNDGGNWIFIGTGGGNSFEHNTTSFIVPPGKYYTCRNGQIQAWVELSP